MSKRKLLLADDSITIQKVVNLTFADEGIEVFTVGDGDSAIERLRETPPDLVMADVNMPGANGYQICELIKQDESLKHIPVILLVGSFEPFDEEEAKRVGADDFLTKPFQSIRQLVNKVTDLLNSTEGAADSRFAETLEMPTPVEQINPEFDNNDFDDEMIQTDQVGGYPLDETQKFETKEFAVAENQDFGKTQAFTMDETKEFTFDDSKDLEETSETTPDEIAEPSEVYGENQTFDSGDVTLEDIPFPVSATILDLNDDVLELPPVEGEELEEVEEASPDVIGETVDLDDNHQELITPTNPDTLSEFPPELIDAIAQRVIEKLSDQTVREMAREVVAQKAELIIREMVEEKLKE